MTKDAMDTAAAAAGSSRPVTVALEDSSHHAGTAGLPKKEEPSMNKTAKDSGGTNGGPPSPPIAQKRPLAVAVEEDDLEKAVSWEGTVNIPPERRESNEALDVVHDEIPGPRSPAGFRKKKVPTSELDLSLTEHHRKGGGILASQRELNMDMEEFAAGCNLLQAAARDDLVAMLALLEKYPTHVNFRDYDRRTALHVAASEGHLDVCTFLVKKGARINRSDRWGGSPLDDAHRHRQQEVVELLRAHGATTGSLDQTSNLITAAADGDVEEVRLILSLSNGLHINAGDYDKRTALHLAAGEGRNEIVKLLCVAGADVNVEDRWGGRPLDDARRNRHDDVVEFLVSMGAKAGESHEQVDDSSTRRKSSGNDGMTVEFDDLDMIERIGSGAFGEIYKCRWRGTLVAAKCIKSAKIRKEWLANHAMEALQKNHGDVDDAVQLLDEMDLSSSQQDEALADFRQEIRVLRNLRHPNIVLLLAYSTTANYEVMISELMKCSLLDIFKANMINATRMPRKTQIVYAQQLAQGMNYLHTCKPPVIHRDLKPANLLIDHSGVLKISDFGLAKVRPDPKTMEVDQFVMTGETGSYRFMAPEVFRHEDYTETVDIYSYAMILYYLLAGRPPWASMNGLMAAQKAAKDGDRPTIPRDWDERLSYLLQQCWDENPKARPSFEKILEVLDNYSRDVFKTKTDSLRQIGPPPTAVQTGCCVIL